MNRRPFVLLLAAVALVSASCAATPKDEHDIGISRVGLTMAFSNEALEDIGLPPRVIVQLIPFEGTSPDLSPYLLRPGQSPQKTNPFLCPTAPADAAVPGQAPFRIASVPRAGYYRMRNEGSIKLTAAGFSFGFPYPPITTMQVTNIRTAPASGPLATVGGGATVTLFDVVTSLAKNFETLDTYQLSATELDLVRHTQTTSQGSSDDSWTPPVKVYDAGGPGTSWNALGTNLPARKAIGFQGAVSKPRVVDVCGALLETIEVKSTTTIADLGNRTTSGTTTPGPADLTAFATSLGGIIAARSTHTTDVLTVNNAPVTIVTNVTSTLMSLTPQEKP